MTPNDINTYDPASTASLETKRDYRSLFWMVIRLGSAGVTKIDAHPTREHATYEEEIGRAHV